MADQTDESKRHKNDAGGFRHHRDAAIDEHRRSADLQYIVIGARCRTTQFDQERTVLALGEIFLDCHHPQTTAWRNRSPVVVQVTSDGTRAATRSLVAVDGAGRR